MTNPPFRELASLGATEPAARAIADGIATALLADPAQAAAVADDVTAWVSGHPRDVAGHAVAWTASRSVAAAFEAIDGGARSALRPDQLSLLRSLPVAARVSVALHHFVRMTIDEIAHETARSSEEVRRLVGTERSAPPPPVASPPPVEAPAPAPPPLPPPATPVDPAAAPIVRQRVRKRVTPKRRARPWIIASAVVLALIAGGLIASNLREDEPRTRPSASAGLADAASVSKRQLSVGCDSRKGDAALEPQLATASDGDGKRSYRVVAPSAVTPGAPRPLLVDFGDLGQSLDEHVAASHLDEVADTLKVVVATVGPAPGFPQWNTNDRAGDPDDMSLVTTLIERESRRLCIDRTRIVLAGQGAGAHFAAAYACRNPGVVAGVILVAGVYHAPTCTPKTADFSVLAVMGSQDQMFPLNGGTGAEYTALLSRTDGLKEGAIYDVAPTQKALDEFADDLDCAGSASMPLGLVTVRISTSCRDDNEVWRAAVDGAGHQWFGASNELILRFLTEEGPLGKP